MAHAKTGITHMSSGDAGHLLGYDAGNAANRAGSKALEQHRTLDRFLAGVEKRAYRMALIACRNPEDALDIVQDAMMKLAEKYGDRGESELAPLFHRIMQSKIRDWYRRSTVRNRFRSWLGGSGDEDEEDALQLVADPAGRSPDQILEARGGIEALQTALGELPLRQQQVFLLRAWEGLDVRQTAAAMQCAEGSVKTHYSRALAALRVKLGDHWS